MTRWTATLLIFAALSAWAGAQGPAPGLTAADQIRLLKANRTLIGHLVDHGLDLADADTPLQKARECRKTAQSLANELQLAADAQDADRVVELTGHFFIVMRDALVPNLDEAKRTIHPDSPDAAELKKLREKAAADLDAVRAAIPTTGKVGDNAKVKDARSQLDGFTDRLK